MVSQSDLIQDYQQVASELDKQPTLNEYNEHGEHSSYSVYNEFESFDELKQKAGFEAGKYSIRSEDLIEDIQRVADEIGRAPPVEVYREHGEYNFKTPKRRWGSWHDVLEACGFEPTNHSEHWKETDYDDAGKYRNRVEFVCDYCGTTDQKRRRELERRDKNFCSRGCKAKSMSEQTGSASRAWKEKVEIECEVCGDTREVVPSKADGSRFCSQDCMLEWRAEYLSGENNPRWNDSPKYRYYGPNWEEQAAKARDRDNHECQFCPRDRQDSLEEWGEILTVHHIKRFYDFASYEVANELPNLITTCKECHTSLDMGTMAVPEPVKEKHGEWLETVPGELIK